MIVGAFLATAATADEIPSPAGHWEGRIETPGVPLSVKVDLQESEGVWRGTIDIPMQEARGMALEDVSVAGREVSFRIAGIPGAPTFKGRLEGGKLAGTFHQGGASFPFSLSREGVRRPQTPQPPFPYRSVEVNYPGPAGKIAGTLTLPKEKKPAAAVLMISGSGPQDRDAVVYEHSPQRVLADHLSRRGIAVLRVDERGVGESEGSFGGSTSEDFAEDVRAGVSFLRSYSGLPADRVGLVGHSEGGLIAPMLAGEEPEVAFLVLIAAPGVPGREVLARQLALMTRAADETGETVRRREALFKELLELHQAPLSSPDREKELIDELVGLWPPGAGKEMVHQQLQALLAQGADPWFRFFLAYDPRPALAKVKVPVLALYGGKDLQVEAEQNQGELEAALARGGNEDVEVILLPDLNHLMQTAGTGHTSEYWAIEETFAPAALERISSWILERFPVRPAASQATEAAE